MLNNLWMKLTGLATLVAGFFYIKSEFQEHEIEELEDEKEALVEKDRINVAMDEAEQKAEQEEDNEIADIDDTDWSDDI